MRVVSPNPLFGAWSMQNEAAPFLPLELVSNAEDKATCLPLLPQGAETSWLELASHFDGGSGGPSWFGIRTKSFSQGRGRWVSPDFLPANSFRREFTMLGAEGLRH